MSKSYLKKLFDFLAKGSIGETPTTVGWDQAAPDSWWSVEFEKPSVQAMRAWLMWGKYKTRHGRA